MYWVTDRTERHENARLRGWLAWVGFVGSFGRSETEYLACDVEQFVHMSAVRVH